MRKYLYIFRTELNKLILLAVLSVLTSILMIGSIYYGGLFIDVVVNADYFSDIVWICLILLFLSLFAIILDYVVSMILYPLVEILVYNFKTIVLSHLQKTKIEDYRKFDPSYLCKRIDEDTRQIIMFFVSNYITVIIKALEIFVIAILIFMININIGILALVLSPLYFFIYKFFKNDIFQKGLEYREESANFFNGYNNQLEQLEDIVIKADISNKKKILDKQFNFLIYKYTSHIKVNNKLKSTQSTIVSIMQILIFFVGGMAVLEGHTTIGMLSILMAYFNRLLTNITYYVKFSKNYQLTKASIHRIDKILGMELVKEGDLKINNLNKLNATINYIVEDKVILDNINICAEKGDLIIISGKNGAGKTTLLKILVGAIKSDKSNIILNEDIEIRNIDSFYLRNKVLSYIPQKITFNKCTLSEIFNQVALYRDTNDVILQLNELNIPTSYEIEQFISNNWKKDVTNLSGGDKQFINILREILINGDIFVFDEPTSNLDTHRILWFESAVNAIKKDKIVFLVNHSTYENYDYNNLIVLS